MDGISHEPITGVAALPASRKERSLLSLFEREGGNALNAVIGYAELLGAESMDRLPPEHAEWLRQLLNSCQQAKDLFEGLLTASRAESGELVVKFAPERFGRVVQHAVRGATWEAQESGVTLREVGALPDVQVLGDVRALDRVIRGVLRVLIATAGSGGEVSVEANTGDGQVTLTFEASGAQSQPSSPSQLLLRAWQRVLALHEGDVSVDELGTRARIRLPRKSDDAAG